ncbi:multidrug efflux MFS transporter [Salinibacterium sp. ZJ450]|uniref:multidrug efflux MFS transporter n=1 Tax=Salinibacterium sp. ZJ450 TaxID=2708338 RepID=UPI0014226515|nr:multidrug efflux MFS transporter [Salinibacterium sp. ZJ450]
MNTLQQLAGAAGTAVLIAGMTIGAAIAATAGADAALAQAEGAQTAFMVGGVIALIGVVFSFFVRRIREDAADGADRPFSRTAE